MLWVKEGENMCDKFPNNMTIEAVFDKYCDTVYRLATYEKRNGKEKTETRGFDAVYGGTDGYCKTDGEWEKLTYNITLPENANAVKIMLMNQKADSTVCYDNLQIGKAQKTAEK